MGIGAARSQCGVYRKCGWGRLRGLELGGLQRGGGRKSGTESQNTCWACALTQAHTQSVEFEWDRKGPPLPLRTHFYPTLLIGLFHFSSFISFFFFTHNEKSIRRRYESKVDDDEWEPDGDRKPLRKKWREKKREKYGRDGWKIKTEGKENVNKVSLWGGFQGGCCRQGDGVKSVRCRRREGVAAGRAVSASEIKENAEVTGSTKGEGARDWEWKCEWPGKGKSVGRWWCRRKSTEECETFGGKKRGWNLECARENEKLELSVIVKMDGGCRVDVRKRWRFYIQGGLISEMREAVDVE